MFVVSNRQVKRKEGARSHCTEVELSLFSASRCEYHLILPCTKPRPIPYALVLPVSVRRNW